MYIVETPKARVYVNFGRVIADCANDCGSAMALDKDQRTFFCQGTGGCGHISDIEWPSNLDEILDALRGRKPKHMNWFPQDHPLALRAGCPHGQSPAELRAETAEHQEG